MCVSPNLIPNPNYGLKNKFSFMKDTVSKYLKVPCGVCSECVHVKQLSLVQRCIMESQFGYPFYCTLTYNNDSLPVLTTSDGFNIRYPLMSDVTNMIKRLRNDNAFGRPFRYFCVSELGSKRARPHFHLIWFLKKYDSDSVYTPVNLEKLLFNTILSYWCRNYGSRRNPDYRPLLTYVSKFVCGKLKSTYDLHYVVPSPLTGDSADVGFYVTKYMLKPSSKAQRLQQALKLNLSEDEYEDVWKTVKPRWISSLNFGFGCYGLQARKMSYSDRLDYLSTTDSFKYVRSCIDRSLVSQDRPKFYDPDSGRSLPLSRYWKSFGNLFSSDDAVSFYYKDPDRRDDNVTIDDRSMSEKLLSIEKHRRQLALMADHAQNFEILFDYD